MVFSSIPFLYYFLPAVVLGYFLLPRSWRNGWLLAASLLFYGWGEPKYLALMAATILLFYGCGLAMEKAGGKWKKVWLVVSVAVSLALLAVFKYADFFVDSFNSLTGLSVPLLKLALPVGISFYTFQCLSYTVDVYRGNVPAQKNIIHFAAYVAMFPQLIAGPIVRYVDIEAQIESRTASREDMFYGLVRFATGLGKKILIADHAFAVCSQLLEGSLASATVLGTWLGMVMFTFQIYFDFSGYSDMAIGLGRIFGFKYQENFKLPYMSLSITDFWRRWHISLSSWFRDYVYIPLGGNRKGKVRTLVNKLIVFFATGLWHGTTVTFVIWGLWHGLWSVLETALQLPKKLEKRWYGHVYALLVVVVGFVFFRAESLGQAAAILGQMFTGFSLTAAGTLLLAHQLGRRTVCLLVLGCVLCLPVGPWLRSRTPVVLRRVLTLALLALCMVVLASSSFQPFIYVQF